MDTDSLACKRSLELRNTHSVGCMFICTCICTSCSQSSLPSHQPEYFTRTCINAWTLTHMWQYVLTCLFVCLGQLHLRYRAVPSKPVHIALHLFIKLLWVPENAVPPGTSVTTQCEPDTRTYIHQACQDINPTKCVLTMEGSHLESLVVSVRHVSHSGFTNVVMHICM